MIHRLLFILMVQSCACFAVEHWVFLDNGKVRLGANLSAGGCIGWFSHSHSSDNLLNAYDVGRYLQQSYYGDADGSDWNGKPWRYNPVQGGSWRNQPAQIVESREEKDLLYAKIIPRHWATGELLKEVTLEQWLQLEGGLARLKFKVTYTGEKEHKPYHQELPALFVKPTLETLVFVGEDGSLQRKQPGFPNELFRLGPKPWAAWVDARDSGLGLYVPHAQELTSYRVRNGNRGDCSYCAPIRTFALKPGLVFEYEVVLAIGSVEQMRTVFGRLANPP
ncbi:hypothetical protein EI77_03939 [Prosthecobacter fusiformis]|uniref:Uncharacterized protein n=1 Tax=Prosthecobacter fusiformis TaxID=48464 RepID=A0A4R7RLH9_9BACT|nr:hypothetical protein [Prosthecobacter fusiformis]TDU66200.1 hypothetical protein EI77_03939 [Prosthecobacter fusiformis]